MTAYYGTYNNPINAMLYDKYTVKLMHYVHFYPVSQIEHLKINFQTSEGYNQKSFLISS